MAAVQAPFRSTAVRYLATIFVSRIPWTAAANELKEHFSQFGTVRRCFLPFEKDTGFHKGCCWIGFSSEEELQRTLQQESHFIDGVKVHVQRQRHRRQDVKEKI
ncbi:SRA stem-loop-interacting RNA-binding protein, mitochondrial-like [Trichosurus vulpecula]|uniref:SRA stem-loop-interacting RNA-binding protein, mitochondrial n=1 Tax=Trichosurus vulpecula TaxID=9337 RepID=UPI00186AEF58|nr:SRA stem-loop-interacting RNA-binding protein, mitochondrial [Trichosurus vulpecula]XP_036597159.1 SRA stem-loop-interacting RNA-binding protein, mitochondrial-like [Trichosurus vulpecula]